MPRVLGYSARFTKTGVTPRPLGIEVCRSSRCRQDDSPSRFHGPENGRSPGTLGTGALRDSSVGTRGAWTVRRTFLPVGFRDNSARLAAVEAIFTGHSTPATTRGHEILGRAPGKTPHDVRQPELTYRFKGVLRWIRPADPRFRKRLPGLPMPGDKHGAPTPARCTRDSTRARSDPRACGHGAKPKLSRQVPTTSPGFEESEPP